MPRTALTAQTTPGKYPSTPITANAADFTWAASDSANGNSVTATGRELLLVRNDNAGAQTVTVSSVADEKNRTGDISTYSVGAGEYAAFGPFPKAGWAQSDGALYIDTSSNDIKVAVIQLPL